MSEIEKELRDATSFKPKTKYPDRADYLSDLALACDKLSDKEFAKISEDARNWVNSAITAVEEKDEPPEFDDAVIEGEESPDDIEAELTGDVDDPEDPSDVDDQSEGNGEDLDPEDVDTPRRPIKAKVTNKPVNGPAKGSDKFRERPKGSQPKVPMAGKKHSKGAGPHQYPHAARDKFGLVIGSKVSQACEMFEKGCPMTHVIKSLGGPQNNVLGKLAAEGHRVERFEGVIHLIHKDEIKEKGTKSADKPPAKAPAKATKRAAAK